MITRLSWLFVAIWIVNPQAATAEPIGLQSLLEEMTDRARLARFPDPPYDSGQASSHDRAARSPDDPGWFANNDKSWFLRQEVNDGRTEWVMLDEEGPGAIVRWWVTARRYEGTIRIYIDDAPKPTVEARVDELVGGDLLVDAPLSATRAKGRNLYLPIPYARRCKVTYDRNYQDSRNRDDLLYYQIGYRRYAPGTEVESFSLDRLALTRPAVEKAQATLLDPDAPRPERARREKRLSRSVPPGAALRGPSFRRTAAICRLTVRLEADDPVQALRSTVLVMQFDDQQTIWSPVGDFFGSGVGVNSYQDWYRRVEEDGTMTSRWIMPFEKKCAIRLENLGKQTVDMKVSAEICPWRWDDRSMYFHTTWRQQRGIDTSESSDWNYLEATGQGVFVGDTLAVLNRVARWWGEGDEKIYVDGEPFPSQFGTGTEDYYGYAWCRPWPFEAPFHAQPRAEGPRNFGQVTNTRVRLLDAIPFRESFVFDLEILHSAKTIVDYAATTHWYARPGAASTIRPMPREAEAAVAYRTEPLLIGFRLFEPSVGSLEMQAMRKPKPWRWRDADQVVWRGGAPGATLAIGVPVAKPGRYRVRLEMTMGADYGIVQFHVNGEKASGPVDFFDPVLHPAEPILLGPFDLAHGESTLLLEIVGANERATGGFVVGIDRIALAPAE